MVTPAQVRAARALLDWSQKELADRSNVFVNTIISFEQGKSNPKRTTMLAIEKAFRQAGIMFVEDDGEHGAGVRFTKSDPVEYMLSQ